jgi:5-methylcytosine-specific restriction endonuclease McrA
MKILKVPISSVVPWDKNPRASHNKLLGKDREVTEVYQGGKSTTQTALIFGVSQRAIWECLKRNGVSRRGVGARKGERRSPESEFKPGGTPVNKGRGMSPELQAEARRTAWAKFNRKPERKLYMKNYDIRYGRYHLREDFWKWLCAFLDNRCQSCGHQFPFRKLEIDHIVPLSKGGAIGDPLNVQPLCRSCNARKKNADYFPSEAVVSAQQKWVEVHA